MDEAFDNSKNWKAQLTLDLQDLRKIVPNKMKRRRWRIYLTARAECLGYGLCQLFGMKDTAQVPDIADEVATNMMCAVGRYPLRSRRRRLAYLKTSVRRQVIGARVEQARFRHVEENEDDEPAFIGLKNLPPEIDDEFVLRLYYGAARDFRYQTKQPPLAVAAHYHVRLRGGKLTSFEKANTPPYRLLREQMLCVDDEFVVYMRERGWHVVSLRKKFR